MGYMHVYCTIQITPKFDLAFKFRNDLAPVKINNKYGYINKTGNFEI
jgi:hypothetical protein